MQQLKQDLNALTKDLQKLTKTADRMLKNVEKMSKATAKKKATSKALKGSVAKKAKRVPASGTVLPIITGSMKGVDVAQLKEQTGFGGRKVNDIVHRLKKEGKIKSGGRGIYVKI